jgi:hypothetical protein
MLYSTGELGRRSAAVFEGKRCRAAVWAPVEGVLVTRVTCHAKVEVVRFYTARVQRELLTQRRLRIFHDWSQVTVYDAAAREAIRVFGANYTDETLLAHYLVQSKLVGMAIQTAGLI